MEQERLIAPITQGWNEGERDWKFVKDPKSSIEQWEAQTDLKLPGDYRRFMLAFNGGIPYPNLLKHNVPPRAYPSETPVTIIDPFYDWRIVEKSWGTSGMFRDTLPRNMLAIGADPGMLVILLSLAKNSYGKVFVWVNRGETWGTDDNVSVWEQAESFSALIESLHDDAEKTGWDYWNIPEFVKLAKPLKF